MRYMLLIHDDPAAYEALSPEGIEKLQAEHGAFIGALKDAGVAIAYSAELGAAPSAKTVRRTGEDTLVTDGPFSETKEQIGGFYVVDVPDMASAVSWARRIPLMADHDAVEVRAVKQ